MARLAGVVRMCVGVSLTVAAGALAQTYGPSPFGTLTHPFPGGEAGQPDAPAAITDVDRRRLATAADGLLAQRPGMVDAYVVVVALDSDPVFAREAREAAHVLASRYDAQGRTLLLAGLDGRSFDPLPRGSPETLRTAIAQIAAVMDVQEDALILYITAHGSPGGLVYRDRGTVMAALSPVWLDDALRRSRISNRVLIVSACFSGVFVPILASPEGVVITAAAKDRTSFGCASDNDWTFFGDALINHALRKSQPLAAAFGEARGLVSTWETSGKLIPSNPQIAIGAQAAAWLKPIEARMPKVASAPVGRPAIDALDKAVAANH